jgi:hypothetical protein
VKKKNENNMRIFIEEYLNIFLYVVEDDHKISPSFGFSMEQFKQFTKDMALYLSGFHKLSGNNSDFTMFPFCFYDEMNLDRSIFYNYFPVVNINDNNLIRVLETNLPIVFCHDQSSTHESNLLQRQGLSIENNIVINPSYNMYPSNHPFYEIAQEYVFLPLAYYIPLIEISDTIIMFDSSFWCMVSHLSTKAECEKYCYYRHESPEVYPGYRMVDPSFKYVQV